jgi:ABC-2 type transport system permease protein
MKIQRLYRIFSICIQDALQYRSEAFVWFLLSMFNTLSALLLWVSGFANKSITGDGISLPSIQLYYLFLLVVSSSLLSHIEESVARYDIKEGKLVSYLLKPFSYFWMKFFGEVPWRIMGLVFSCIAMFIFSNVFHIHLPTPSLILIPGIVIVCLLALFLSFMFKMVISLVAFWITEGWALFEIVDVLIVIFAGSIMPLQFFPEWIRSIATILPFSYMIYFPVQALLGALTLQDLGRVILIQGMWIGIFTLVQQTLWKKGINLFTGVGQ